MFNNASENLGASVSFGYIVVASSIDIRRATASRSVKDATIASEGMVSQHFNLNVHTISSNICTWKGCNGGTFI
jgi:hypothetical protein